MVKPDSRVLGFDDGPFTFDTPRVPVVGVLSRGKGYVEAALVTDVAVDGTDATQRILELARSSTHVEAARLVLLDGATMGGFNVVDLDALHAGLGVPVATLTRDEPDLADIEAALRGRFDDWAARLALLRRHRIEPVDVEDGAPVWVQRAGVERDELAALLRAQTVRGRTPEPLRVAHLIATALVEGRSRGA